MKALKGILCVVTAFSIVAFALSIYYSIFYKDTVVPEITVATDIIEASIDDGDDVLLQGVSATDDRSGDLTDQVKVAGTTQLTGYNTAKITYYVFDEAENMGTASRIIRYSDYEAPHFLLLEELIFPLGADVTLKGKVLVHDVKDGNITNSARLSSMDLNNTIEGVYHITLRAMNRMGDVSVVTLPVIIRNDNPNLPVIKLKDYLLYINEGDSFEPGDYIKALYATGTAAASEALSEVEITNEVDTTAEGNYEVHYSYTNAAGFSSEAILTVIVQHVEEAA